MAELRKVEALDESLLVRWFTGPIAPWVPREIPETGTTDLIAMQLELQKSIYQAKIAAVDRLVAQDRSRK